MLLLGKQETWGSLCSSVVKAKSSIRVRGDDMANLEPNSSHRIKRNPR